MQIDKITFNDIAIFHQEEEYSIFHQLNFTRTAGGREWLRRFFLEPHHDLERIKGIQNVIRMILSRLDEWPEEISNGTVIMMDKFLDYPLDAVPEKPNAVNSMMYKIFHAADYSMLKYSVKHFADFFRGMQKISIMFHEVSLPPNLQFYLDRINKIFTETALAELAAVNTKEELSRERNLYFAYFLRTQYKQESQEMMEIYYRLEAWYSMATAMRRFDLRFPEFRVTEDPYLNVQGLFHISVSGAVSYELEMEPSQNFLFLTGANMAGKSTLIKAIGGAVFLAHLGMGVPARKMELSLFDGMITNINVADNIVKGESFFFNEVQRIKNTITRINDGRKWLVLIDELFKGTNVQDAMKCSLAVIRGLMKIRTSLFVLSTHLYEIGEELQDYPNISFKYFETNVLDDQLDFTYQLKDGISNDRIGYVILRREKVVDLLDKL